MIDPLYIIYFFPFVFILIFAYFFYINRARNSELVLEKPSVLKFSLELSEPLRKEAQRKIRILKYAPSVSILVTFFLILLAIALGLDLHINDLDPRVARLMSFFGLVLFLIFIFMSFILTKMNKEHINRFKNILDLSLKDKLVFEISNGHIKVPTLLLANPAFFRASEDNLNHIEIPLSDIISLEVFDGSKSQNSQFKILASGNIAKFGYGRLGDSAFFEFGICIRRTYFKEDEYQILCILNELVGKRLIIRANIIQPKKSSIENSQSF
jgi:hypothetical protein